MKIKMSLPSLVAIILTAMIVVAGLIVLVHKVDFTEIVVPSEWELVMIGEVDWIEYAFDWGWMTGATIIHFENGGVYRFRGKQNVPGGEILIYERERWKECPDVKIRAVYEGNLTHGPWGESNL